MLQEYGERFEILFGSDQNKLQWILKLLHREVFGGKDELTRKVFMEFRGLRADKDLFWKRISQIALESYTMHEVFNMDSTVRLAAVENLGKNNSCFLPYLLVCKSSTGRAIDLQKSMDKLYKWKKRT